MSQLMNFDVQELGYYFDAARKDALDRGGVGRKNGQLLQLREKMLQLEDAQFDMAIRTMENMVLKPVTKEAEKKREQALNRREAQELYQETRHATAEKEPRELKISVV